MMLKGLQMDQVQGIGCLSKVTIMLLAKPFLPPHLRLYSMASITTMVLKTKLLFMLAVNATSKWYSLPGSKLMAIVSCRLFVMPYFMIAGFKDNPLMFRTISQDPQLSHC